MNALCAMVCDRHRRKTRQFLEGLATTELQYIAEFLGSWMVEGLQPCQWSRAELVDAIERFDRSRAVPYRDREHKMILVLEYLCRSNPEPAPIAVRAARP